MFFSKIRLNITGSVHSRRFPIIVHLAVEDNLLKSNSNLFRFYHSRSLNGHEHYSYSLYSFFRLNLKVQFSEQIPEHQYVNTTSLIATNPNSCSTAGNRTYFYFPVQMYLADNITGLITIRLHARMLTNTMSARLRKYAFTSVLLTIDNGEIIILCIDYNYVKIIRMRAGCSGDLLYELSSGKCVESCSHCAISVTGSCQPFTRIGKTITYSERLNFILACM